MLWDEWLRQDTERFANFLEYLAALKDGVTEELYAGTMTLEQAKAARKILDKVRHAVTMAEKEATDFARFQQASKR